MQRIDGTNVTMAMPIERVAANIAAANARGLKAVHDLSDWREHTPIAIIGGGPSLCDYNGRTIDVARRYRNTMVCGSAYDYVLGRGIVPRWAVVCDPDPIMALYLRRAHRDTTFLVASQCDAAVFKELEDRDVALWHCRGPEAESSDIWGEGQRVLVGGGCTVLTRAIFLAVTFGFRDIHLFGCDTCVTDRHHAYDFATDQESIGALTPIRLGDPNNVPEFMMADYMVGQLFDFKKTLEALGNRARFEVHGGGALAELMRLGREAAQQRKAA
jgi:uncharacterized Rossmann fold enzyme